MDENSTVNQFALSQTSFHTHNGIDSQKVAFINLSDTPTSYYGEAGSVVTVNSTENGLTFEPSATVVYGGVSDSSIVPPGWSRSAAGHVVTYTHNLGHTNYSVVGSFENTAGIAVGAYVSVDNKTSTSFDICRYRDSDGVALGGRNDWVLFDYNSYV